MLQLYINCRFLTQRITGVQRFAFEICRALDHLLLDRLDLKVIGLLPKKSPIQVQYGDVPFRQIKLLPCGVFEGHVWEQFELPWYSRGHHLVNLCNVAPLLKFDQSITLHDVIFMTNLDSQKWWFKLLYKFIAKCTSSVADHVFTVSQFSKREIIHFLGPSPEKVVVLGNAANLDEYPYKDNILDKFSLSSRSYFLMIGSSSARKNISLVAKLFMEQSSLQNSNLVIVGGRYANLSAERRISATNIIYTDYISDGELRSLYHHAQALIFPSTCEGFGISLVEAMSEAIPLIAADIPVLHEVCSESALYFSPYSPSELEEKILLLINNSELTPQLIELGRLQLSNYKWSRFAKILLETVTNKGKI